MKTISKRELVRNPSLVAHLKAGEAMEIQDKKGTLVISRPKKRRLTAAQIHAELDKLGEGLPKMDTLAALKDLRE